MAADIDAPFVSSADRRLILNQLLRARERVHRLTHAASRARTDDPDLSKEVRWFLWRQEVRRAAAAAELEQWQRIHQQVEAWRNADA